MLKAAGTTTRYAILAVLHILTTTTCAGSTAAAVLPWLNISTSPQITISSQHSPFDYGASVCLPCVIYAPGPEGCDFGVLGGGDGGGGGGGGDAGLNFYLKQLVSVHANLLRKGSASRMTMDDGGYFIDELGTDVNVDREKASGENEEGGEGYASNVGNVKYYSPDPAVYKIMNDEARDCKNGSAAGSCDDKLKIFRIASDEIGKNVVACLHSYSAYGGENGENGKENGKDHKGFTAGGDDVKKRAGDSDIIGCTKYFGEVNGSTYVAFDLAGYYGGRSSGGNLSNEGAQGEDESDSVRRKAHQTAYKVTLHEIDASVDDCDVANVVSAEENDGRDAEVLNENAATVYYAGDDGTCRGGGMVPDVNFVEKLSSSSPSYLEAMKKNEVGYLSVTSPVARDRVIGVDSAVISCCFTRNDDMSIVSLEGLDVCIGYSVQSVATGRVLNRDYGCISGTGPFIELKVPQASEEEVKVTVKVNVNSGYVNNTNVPWTSFYMEPKNVTRDSERSGATKACEGRGASAEEATSQCTRGTFREGSILTPSDISENSAEFSNEPVVVMMANYEEPIDWVRSSPFPCVVYSKHPSKSHLSPHYVPVNVAGEASAYLKFIVDYYDILPRSVVFLHSHRYAYHQEDIVILLHRLASRGADWSDKYCNINMAVWGYKEDEDREWLRYHWGKWLGKHFGDFSDAPGNGGRPHPHPILDRCCAQFIVGRDRIYLRGREFYEEALSVMYEAEDAEDKVRQGARIA